MVEPRSAGCACPGGGTIDKAELREALKEAGCECSEEQLVSMIRVADEGDEGNGDGEISFEEFCYIMKVVHVSSKVDKFQGISLMRSLAHA